MAPQIINKGLELLQRLGEKRFSQLSFEYFDTRNGEDIYSVTWKRTQTTLSTVYSIPREIRTSIGAQIEVFEGADIIRVIKERPELEKYLRLGK